MPISVRLQEVLTRVLEGVSGRQAERKIESRGERLSYNTINDAKNYGQYRSLESLRMIARAYSDRIMATYGDEVREAFDGDPKAPEQWLVQVATRVPPRGEDPVYEADLEDKLVKALEGVRDLPPEDIRHLEGVMRSYVSALRRARGLE